jgi:hypothetical protein
VLATMSSSVTVYGARGSDTGGSWTGTGLGSSVGVSGASSAGSRSLGSESGLLGVFLNVLMQLQLHDRYPHQRLADVFGLGERLRFFDVPRPVGFMIRSRAAMRTDNLA